MSDHNVTVVARKLTKERFQNITLTPCHSNVFCIPKSRQDVFDNEINNMDWGVALSSENLELSCQLFTSKIFAVRDKFTVKIQRKNRKKSTCLGSLKTYGN